MMLCCYMLAVNHKDDIEHGDRMPHTLKLQAYMFLFPESDLSVRTMTSSCPICSWFKKRDTSFVHESKSVGCVFLSRS